MLGLIRQGAPPAFDASNLGPRERTDVQDPGHPLRDARVCLGGWEALMTEHIPQGRPPYLPYWHQLISSSFLPVSCSQRIQPSSDSFCFDGSLGVTTSIPAIRVSAADTEPDSPSVVSHGSTAGCSEIDGGVAEPLAPSLRPDDTASARICSKDVSL